MILFQDNFVAKDDDGRMDFYLVDRRIWSHCAQGRGGGYNGKNHRTEALLVKTAHMKDNSEVA